ncbi:WbqC family protein [Chitinophaga sp. Cy-1792]|uniref:WbqC family protein n=1 Tax=Chitinophaga sp. Cy-1792 TaxID=2608339 RepID=UPI001F04CCE1|nr:WbqC family protein [Chitinophaga sp. Cy-1792]
MDVKNQTLLIESQYFPSVNFYQALAGYENLLIEKFEHYQKVSYRNRCYLAGPNGRMILSVPLTKGKNQRTVMKDVRISNEEKWQSLHWKTLVSAYRRSPWFEYYEPELEALYEKPFEYLLDWNMACMEWANNKLGLSQTITFTDGYEKTVSGVDDMRDKLVPGIVPEDSPVYTQVFEDRTGFLRGMSILDLLFCEGKQAAEIISQAK